MKATIITPVLRRFRLGFLFVALSAIWFCATPAAQAGLTLELNVVRYSYQENYFYYFSPYLNTNSTPPDVAFGTYFITSPGYPTNGANAKYKFDSNGFNQTDGGSGGFNSFDSPDMNDSLVKSLTNGQWTIYVTNAVTTNAYHFNVTVNITSNALPNVVVTFPAYGAVDVTNRPTFTWQGPTNYNDLVVYYYNNSSFLPVAQTSLLSSIVLYQGINHFTAHYDSNSTTAVVSSIPRDNASNPISSWVSTAHLQTYFESRFTVGAVDTSGTSHALVAHYPWDGTNGDGTVSGVDTSGNGYDMNFGGGLGSQGGVNSTTTPMVGPRAIQFHNGDGNSAGYVGWNPTPAGLLTALSGSFSISCWIKTTQNIAWDEAPAFFGAGIVSADNSGLANDLIPLALTGSKIGFNTGGDSEDVTLNSLAIVNDGNYHHVVVARNQSTGQKLIYIDGVLDSFSSGTTNRLNDPRLLTIGALADANDPDASSTGYSNGYEGLLDDVQIYSGVLSSNEVANLFVNPGATSPNSSGGHSIAAHYAFEDGSNTYQLGVDSSPHANTLNGYSYWGQVHTNTTVAVAGTNAVQFFGTSSMNANDQVLTNLNALLIGDFTFSAWVKTTASRGNDFDNAYFGATIFWAFNDHNATNDTIPLAITGSKAAFTTRDHLGNFNTLHSTTSVNDGNYHLLTVTRKQATGEKKIYVDGNFEDSEIGTTEPLNGNNYYLSIGGTVYSSYTGILDEVQVYSGVLSGSDVAYLYSHPGATVLDVAGQDFNDALNTTGLTWITGGDSPWFVETTNTHDNVSAAQSGAIGDDRETWIETTVTGPGTLSFWWKVSSEDGSDYLEFNLDGGFQDELSGDSDWQQQTYAIDPGSHALRWRYYKDGSVDDGLDAGFLDQVSFVVPPPITNTPPIITLNPFNQTNYPGYNVALLAAATSNAALTWQWYKVGNATPIPNATNGLYIPANSGTAGVAGNYFAIATNLVGSATTTVATVTFQTAALPPDWTRAFASPYVANAAISNATINLASQLDAAGNIYTVGSVTGTNVFGSNTLISANGMEESCFLKQTATGTPIWGRSMTNNGNGNSFPRGIAPAPGDGFYVLGLFRGTNWLGANKLPEVADACTYLARFDADGNTVWVRTIIGTNANFPFSHTLVSDPAGNVTLSVLISGYTSFGTTNLFATGQQGILAQYDADGNVRWLQIPSAWPNYLAYSAGRIYGNMSGGSTNYIGGFTNVSDRRQALFSINATNGQGIWVQGIGAQKDEGPGGFANETTLVAVAGTNVFVTGASYGPTAVFGAFSVNLPVGNQYFARYDTDGNARAATSFGSRFSWLWASVADAAGNLYVGADFDTYASFGNYVLAAPFYETVQFVGSIENRLPGQAYVAKFDRNGNPLWARSAQSPSSYLNLRDIILAPDGVWACGFFYPIGNFGTNTIYGGLAPYHRSGYLAKITDGVAAGLPVTLLNPQYPGSTFQFSFMSLSGFTHSVLYRTNLSAGIWQTNSSVAGDGTLKTINIPLSVFGGAKQGFVRVSTQ